MVTNSDYKTPSSELIMKTNCLNVHQQMAHLSLSQVFGIHTTQLPAYHFRQLFGQTVIYYYFIAVYSVKGKVSTTDST